MISFFERKPDSRFMTWIYRVAKTVRKIRFSSEAVELGDALEGTFDHYFEQTELESELEKAGFNVIEYAGTPFAHAVAVRSSD